MDNDLTAEQIKNKMTNEGFRLSDPMQSTMDTEFLRYFYGMNNGINLEEFLDKIVFAPSFVLFGMHYSFLNCIVKNRTIKVKPNILYSLDLSQEIGKGRLLYINYTPQGPVSVVELHGNCPMGSEYNLNKQLYLLSLSGDSTHQEIDISVMYSYISEKYIKDTSIYQLVKSFENFFYNDYILMVINAQIACEFLITKLLFDAGIGKNNIEKASYNLKLNQLFPECTKRRKMPPFPSKMLQNLNDMRQCRNEIAHEGGNKVVQNTDAKSWIISAVMLYKYIHIPDIMNQVIERNIVHTSI